MTHDRDLDDKVRTWLDEPPPGPPDRDAVYARVLDRLPETHQRRHWWPFQWNPFAAGATRSADANGPRPQGRSRTMLNPVRAVVLVAALALASSFAMVTEVAAPGPIVPGAEAPGEAIAHVVGHTSGQREIAEGEMQVTDRAIEWRGMVAEWDVTADDPRLSGVMTAEYALDNLMGVAGAAALAGTQTISNADGEWSGTVVGVGVPDTNDIQFQSVLTGSGAYDGLTAVVRADNAENVLVYEFEAVVFPGSLPGSE